MFVCMYVCTKVNGLHSVIDKFVRFAKNQFEDMKSCRGAVIHVY